MICTQTILYSWKMALEIWWEIWLERQGILVFFLEIAVEVVEIVQERECWRNRATSMTRGIVKWDEEHVEEEECVEGDFWGLVFSRFLYNREHNERMELDENNDLCLGLNLGNVGPLLWSSNKRSEKWYGFIKMTGTYSSLLKSLFLALASHISYHILSCFVCLVSWLVFVFWFVATLTKK